MKTLYVKGMRRCRSIARRVGILNVLERYSRRNAQWIRSLFSIYDCVDLASLDVAWWTYPAIDEIEAFLARTSNARVFKYGAGASTLWLAKRCFEVTSVEHDAGFTANLQPHFEHHSNLHLQVVPDVPVTTASGKARSLRAGYLQRAFDSYVASIDAVSGEFDMIVIDGRARNTCLAKAIPRLRADGILLFDNSDRREYRRLSMAAGCSKRSCAGARRRCRLPARRHCCREGASTVMDTVSVIVPVMDEQDTVGILAERIEQVF